MDYQEFYAKQEASRNAMWHAIEEVRENNSTLLRDHFACAAMHGWLSTWKSEDSVIFRRGDVCLQDGRCHAQSQGQNTQGAKVMSHWISDILRRGEPRQLGTDDGQQSILLIWHSGQDDPAFITEMLCVLNSQPKLLEACEAALGAVENPSVSEMLHAAIAAAKGQE